MKSLVDGNADVPILKPVQMKQPDLGKKVSELRLAKGLTQSELAEKCNLSLRTIQRIETADVTPRSYTVKLIFGCLDYQIYNSFGRFSYNIDRLAYKLRVWLRQFYRYVLDLFNLKTNAMKKITILLASASIILLFVFMKLDTNAQGTDDIKASIATVNADFIKWMNAGQIDSIGLMYLETACLVPDDYRQIIGRNDIRGYYKFLYNSGFRLTINVSESLIVTDSIAIDRGTWNATLHGSIPVTGTYLSQWRLVNGKWFIENEMTNSDKTAFLMNE